MRTATEAVKRRRYSRRAWGEARAAAQRASQAGGSGDERRAGPGGRRLRVGRAGRSGGEAVVLP